ncbi:MAG: hypothetical protein F9B45_26930 [Phycisphaera sp. RhM]|nr:hypothetical protein [Phycisphaera sp. RhM]
MFAGNVQLNVLHQNHMETPSPYSPPAQTDDLELTGFQKACLRNVLSRRRNPSKLRFILRQWPAVVGYAAISAAVFGFIYAMIPDLFVIYLAGAFAIGFFIASVASTLGDCMRQFRVWPAIDRVIDWEKLQQLVE